MPSSGLIVVVAAVLVFVIGAVAQVMALYHLVRYLGAQTPEQRWTRGLLGVFALLWTRGLPDKAVRHLALFLRWEGVFIVMFAFIAIGDTVMRHQPNNFIPASAPAISTKQ